MISSRLAARDSGVEVVLDVRSAGTGGEFVAVDVDHAARRIVGCSESREYVFRVDGPGTYALFIDDCEPDASATTPNEWRWQAGFFAGEVTLEVENDCGALVADYRIVVAPAENKVAAEDFDAMVEELRAFDPELLFGFESGRRGMGAEGAHWNVHLAYARLRLYGPGFVQALSSLRQRPQTRLVSRRELKPLHQARHIDATTIRHAATQSAAGRVLRLGVAANTGDAMPTFDVPAAEHTLDNPANRTVLALLHTVVRQVRTVRKALAEGRVPIRDAQALEAYRQRLPRRLGFLDELDDALRRSLRLRPFCDVTRAEVSAAGLNTVSANPLYARIHRTGWQAIRLGIAGDRLDAKLWTSPTWQVYERWTFLRTCQAVTAALDGAEPKVVYPTSRDDCIEFTWTRGPTTVKAHLQSRCPAWDQTPWRGFASLSGERIPDIVITRDGPDGRHYLVLDAKYRVSRQAVLDAMSSAHIYRDCLRWYGASPTGAYLLVPAAGGAPWLESAEFHARHRCGVVALGLSGPTGVFTQLVAEFVSPRGAGQTQP
jgi:hypothetical protein